MTSWDEAEQQIELRVQQAAREKQRIVGAEQARQRHRAAQERLADIAIQQMYDSFNASVSERDRILRLITQNCPEKRWDVSRHFSMLNEIRTLAEWTHKHERGLEK